jgi:hypothetical protein
MASEMAKAANRGDGGDLRECRTGQVQFSQNIDAATADQVVASIRKNSREQYKVAIRTWRSVTFIDLRLYVQNGAGELVPTKSGITIKVDAVDDIVRALVAAGEVMRGAAS